MRIPRYIACPVLLLCCLLCLSACQTTPEEEVYDPEKQGIAERVRHYQGQVAKTPEDSEMHYRLGNALLDMGRYQDAYVAYQRAIALKPDFANAYANLGLSLRKMGNLKAAIGAYEHTLDLNPGDKTTLNNLATIAEISEDWERVTWCYGELHALEPDNLGYTGNYAALLYELGKYEAAVPVLQSLINADLDVAANTYRLGYCYYSLDQWPAAVEHWEKARTLAPDNGPVNRGLLSVYIDMGNREAAQVAAERCRAMNIALDPALQQKLDGLLNR